MSLTFKCDVDWTVQVPSTVDWVTVSPAQGQAGTSTVKVTVAENTGYDERNASLTLKCELNTATFVISQKQRDALLVSSSRVEMDEAGGTFNVDVQANVQVTCEIPAQYGGWLKAVDGRGLTSKSYTFSVAANDTNEPRSGQVIFKSGSMRETVDVYQIAGDMLVLGSHEAALSASGGRVEIGVQSNIEFGYTVTEGADWIHPVESRALSSHTVYFDIDAYDNTDTGRVGIITFASKDGKLTELFTVSQRMLGAVTVGAESIRADYAGGTYEIELASNYTVRVYGPSDWVKMGELRQSRAMTPYIQEFTVMPNYVERERRCELKITSPEDKDIEGAVTLIQDPLEYTVTTTLPQDAYRDARTHEFEIKVDTRAPFVLEPSSDKIVSLGEGRFRIRANQRSGYSGMETVAIRVAGQYVKMINVNYGEPINPKIKQKIYTASGQAGRIKVQINCNTDIECSVGGSAAGWLSLVETEIAETGTATDVWTFDVAENSGSGDARTGYITFKAGDMWSETVTVNQDLLRVAENAATVTLDGTKSLAEVVGDNMMEIESLDLYGQVNCDDILTLRKMATQGKLIELDMSRVELKRDSRSYWTLFGQEGRITDDNVVGNFMFYKTNLARVKLPDAAVSLGIDVFNGSTVEEVEIGPNVASIGEQCFKNCEKLRKVNIPDLVEEIPEDCFYGTYQLSELTMGRGVKRIGRLAFSPKDCYTDIPSQLTSINLPDGLEEIGFKAFHSSGLITVTIPSTVKRIGDYAFGECRSLRSIKFENQMDTLPRYILNNTVGLREIEFPRGLKVIGVGAFAGTDIEYLTVPEGVVELCTSALESAARKGCILPQSLEIIGNRALAWRSQCSEFTIPANVKQIGTLAFYGTWSVKHLHIQCPTPPKCIGNIFSASVSDCTLYVPAGTADVYRQTAPWSGFKAIVEE